MNDIQYSILSQPKKPTSSQGTRAISWASINNSLQGFQSLNFQAPQTPKTAFHEQNSMTNAMQKFFVLPRQEGPKNPQKELSSPKNTSSSKPKAHIVSTYTQQPKVKKTMNGNKTVKVNSQMKVCGSLPNLLSVPLKPENSIPETTSPKERIAAEQKKRVINQIATNFRFKPGHNSQSPGAKKNMHTYRDQLQVEPGSFNLISARMESPSKDKISSRKTIILSDSKQSSPRQISFRTTEKTTKLFFGKADSIKDLSQFGDDASPSAFKGSKVISNRSMVTHKQDETQNFAKEALKIMADGEKKLLRPQTSTQKLSTYKAALLDSKVTEEQRERFAMFLGDEFVNDLIYTKYYQVMDEDEKQNAIIALRQKMEQNKSIREKFNETLTGGDQNFFEQFNSAGKISRQTTFNLQNQSKSRIEPSSPITMSPRVFNGFPNIPGPEALTPKDLPLEESRSRIGLNALSGFGSPRQNKPKGDDYYTNLELTKMIDLDEAKKKKKPKFKRLWTSEMEAMEKDRFSRIRKCLQEKLLKCVELKVTAQEMSKKITIFTTKAFEKQGSYTFLKAAKYGDIQTITQYLQQDRFYVLEYDTLKQTALHWATKKGHLDICKILIENRADVDAIDMGGRTPIYYALRDENPELVRLLLASKASPWSIRGHNYMECCKDERSKRYLSKARQLSLLLAFHKIKDRASIWEREVNRFLAPIVSMSADNSLMVK